MAAASAVAARIRVVIDIRENDLWEALQPYVRADDGAIPECGWYVEKGLLDVGDIAFYKDASEDTATPFVILERKTADDMGASQKDGRYREQRARLLALRGTGTSIAYIVESPPWSPTLSRTWCRGTFNEVHLQQAIVRLQFRYTIPVFMAASIKETVQWIRRISNCLVTDTSVFQTGLATNVADAAAVYTDAIHVKKASNSSPERIFLSFLLAIPGLGKVAADAISNATNNKFQTLYEFTEEQIATIPVGKRKVGSTLAKLLYTTLHT